MNPGDMVQLIPNYRQMKAYLGMTQLDRSLVDQLGAETCEVDCECDYNPGRVDVVFGQICICCPIALLEVAE